MEKILILDFGSQTTALIGRRIREMGVYTEIISGDTPLTQAVLEGVCGIILSGSPESVYADGPKVDGAIYQSGLPLLGICYGLHRITTDLGGLVEPLPQAEYGRVAVRLLDADVLMPAVLGHEGPGHTRLGPAAKSFFARLAGGPAPLARKQAAFTAWMSHGDTVSRLAPGFVQCGVSETGYPAVVAHNEKPWFGVQFHPEASHCERGSQILAAFVFDVCKCTKNWTVEQYVREAGERLKKQAEGRTVLLLISGGVDSTVTAALLLKYLNPECIYLMYIDTGLMRKNETAEVEQALRRLGAQNLHIIHAEEEFLSRLAGISAPEEKRKIIGDLFITVQEREVEKLKLPADYLLVQGTLYTDLIESGKGIGIKARLIKSHHNVGSPLVEAKRQAGRILEPLERFYKDEVRAAGRLLGLSEAIVMRHPFPGPGLAVRILGEVTREKCEILRQADSIFLDELKKRQSPRGKPLYAEIWQAFAVLLPLRSVGVAGDERRYGYVLSLRAVTSADGMTADVYQFESKDLVEISTIITNTVKDIGRVCYDISSKPPATIEWE
ncbi:MAG: glutamine-hydrolyzing GMP synthase [Spirochaetaceae bacterium]|jgi:GMP synthase (glutamine-hydrolysing)|nr:glutamine-hydrolyzing GMP synthase [Spirochaetaceae bacterium]